MGECGLYLGQRELGRLTWETVGDRLRLQASCPCEPGLIYRVVLQTERGEHRLGVMLPENERFTLRRELPAETLPHCAFIDRTLPEEAHLPGLPLAFSAFFPVQEGDDLLLSCAGSSGLKSAWWKDTCYFLFPLQPGARCEVAPFLCLTTVLQYQNGLYGIFCRRDGEYLPLTDRLRSEVVLS